MNLVNMVNGYAIGYNEAKSEDGGTSEQGGMSEILLNGGLVQIVETGYTDIQEVKIGVVAGIDPYNNSVPLQSYVNLWCMIFDKLNVPCMYTTITMSNNVQATGVLANLNNGYYVFHHFMVRKDKSNNSYVDLTYTGTIIQYGNDFSNNGAATGSEFCAFKHQVGSAYECWFYICTFGTSGNVFLKTSSSQFGASGCWFGLIVKDEFIAYLTSDYETTLTSLLFRSNDDNVSVSYTNNCYGVEASRTTANYTHIINAIVPPATSENANSLGLSSMCLNLANADDPRFYRMLMGHYPYPIIFGIKDITSGETVYVMKIYNTVNNTSANNIITTISNIVS